MSKRRNPGGQGGNQNNQQQKQSGGILGVIRLESRVFKRIIELFEKLKTTSEYKGLIEKNSIKNDKTIPDFSKEKQDAIQFLEKKKKTETKEEKEIIIWLSILRNKNEFKDHIGLFTTCIVDTDVFHETIENIKVFYQLFIDYETERFDLFIKNKKKEINQKMKRAKSEEAKNNLRNWLEEIEKMTLDEYLISFFPASYNYSDGSGVSNTTSKGVNTSEQDDEEEEKPGDDDDDEDDTKEITT